MSEGPTPPEIWGGIECTVNRVGDRHHSQLAANGHLERIESDLDAFASLGITALRYPALWEQIEDPVGRRDFGALDAAMSHLHEGPVRPILGLLHHGSGPLSTDLTDSQLPERLADFARDVASRHPWVTDYTPVNEPLTTARFSGLYGHLYPHTRDDRSFVRMLLTQVRAVVLAMRAIREINPAARLIQTEDLGRASGTRPLRSQLRFENDRRWLTFDLLCGRVVPGHHLYTYLIGPGEADPVELEWLVTNACPPDVIGINHYPRSNRWLDHRLELFHPSTYGGNDNIRYADVAQADIPLMSPPSVASIIRESWRRYSIPVALTEVHIPGDAITRIEWWNDAVRAAAAVNRSGGDVRAVTTWSLLGSFDWDSLCTTPEGPVTYEPGAFDVSAGSPIETPLAEAIRRSTTAIDADADEGVESARRSA
jgi:dTDP-4-dehydrorhamnose reductase